MEDWSAVLFMCVNVSGRGKIPLPPFCPLTGELPAEDPPDVREGRVDEQCEEPQHPEDHVAVLEGAGQLAPRHHLDQRDEDAGPVERADRDQVHHAQRDVQDRDDAEEQDEVARRAADGRHDTDRAGEGLEVAAGDRAEYQGRDHHDGGDQVVQRVHQGRTDLVPPRQRPRHQGDVAEDEVEDDPADKHDDALVPRRVLDRQRALPVELDVAAEENRRDVELRAEEGADAPRQGGHAAIEREAAVPHSPELQVRVRQGQAHAEGLDREPEGHRGQIVPQLVNENRHHERYQSDHYSKPGHRELLSRLLARIRPIVYYIRRVYRV